MLTFSRFLDVAVVVFAAWGLALVALRRSVTLSVPRARWAFRALVAVWCVGYALSTPLVSLALVRALELPPRDVAALDDAALRDRTALVVLSSSVGAGSPGDTPAERLDAEGTARVLGAARVWKRLQTRRVIVSGRSPGPIPEENVRAMRALLVLAGVPDAVIVDEPWALNTRQNALHSVRVGRSLGVTRFVVVTSALHMRRSLREFRRAGVEALAAPVHSVAGRYGSVGDLLPAAWGWSATSASLHELLGMLKP